MARRRGSSWQGSLKTPSKYHRYSFPSEALALAWEAQARAEHKAGAPITPPAEGSQDRVTLSTFFKTQRDVIWPGTLPRNVESNQRAVEKLLGATLPLSQITGRSLMGMVSDMRRAGQAGSTINTRLSHLRVLLRHASRLGLVEGTLDYPWQPKGDNSRMRFLTEQEETALLRLLEHWGLPEVKDLVATLIDTGCRPSELVTGESLGAPVKWSEVSVSAGGTAPDVNDPATGLARATLALMRTKTGKYRVLPLTDRARDALLASKARGDARPFGNLRSDEVSGIIRRAADHLGMPDVVLYTMRHTCASRLVQRGADLHRVMKWMGHTNITTTLRYAKLTPTDIFALGDML